MKYFTRFSVYELRENELQQFNGGISSREVYGALGALTGSLIGGPIGGTVGFIGTTALYDRTSKLNAAGIYKTRNYRMSISPKL